jgi:hypothetical protein
MFYLSEALPGPFLTYHCNYRNTIVSLVEQEVLTLPGHHPRFLVGLVVLDL